MNKKIKEVPNIQRDEFKAYISNILRTSNDIIEYNKVMAKIKREAYQAYIDEGFDKEEALELCKKVF